MTSAQAAARLLRERLDAGAPVSVHRRRTGLEEALPSEGLRAGAGVGAEEPVAVVSGLRARRALADVIAGAILVRDGLPWVATNTDMTIPTAVRPGPGNGALVEVVGAVRRREPVVAGKPEPPLFEETLRRVGGERPLVVGDRLDTDIEGANNAGYDSPAGDDRRDRAAELVAAAARAAADLRRRGPGRARLRPPRRRPSRTTA